MTNSVTKLTSPDRYEITADDTVAGSVRFVDHDGQRIFFHTVVDKEFGGRGLAGELVQNALADTRGEGLRIVPVCPYVKKWLGNHDEFGDIVDSVTPESIELSRNALAEDA